MCHVHCPPKGSWALLEHCGLCAVPRRWVQGARGLRRRRGHVCEAPPAQSLPGGNPRLSPTSPAPSHPLQRQQGCLPKATCCVCLLQKAKTEGSRPPCSESTRCCRHTRAVPPRPALWHLLCPRGLSGSPPAAFCALTSGFAWDPRDTPLSSLPLPPRIGGPSACLALRVPCCAVGRVPRSGLLRHLHVRRVLRSPLGADGGCRDA